MKCPYCKYINPDGAPYCLGCRAPLPRKADRSEWSSYAFGETSGVYRLPYSEKGDGSDGGPEDQSETLSMSRKLPRWEDIYGGGSNAAAPEEQAQPPDVLRHRGFERVSYPPGPDAGSASYPPCRPPERPDARTPLEEEQDAMSSTLELPTTEYRVPGSTKDGGTRAPEPPVSPAAHAQAAHVQPAPGQHVVAAHPAPGASSRPRKAATRGSGSSTLAIMLLGVLAALLLILAGTAVAVFAVKKLSTGSSPMSRLTQNTGVDLTAGRHAAGTPSGRPAPSPKEPEKETKAPGNAGAGEKEEPKAGSGQRKMPPDRSTQASVASGAAHEEAGGTPPAAAFVKNLNPWLNAPPAARLFHERIYDQGDVIEYGGAAFGVAAPAKVFPPEFLEGKIRTDKLLVDVAVTVRGGARLGLFKVFILDAEGRKRGPYSPAEDHLYLPEGTVQRHGLWKKTGLVPEGETRILHRGFLVAPGSASSFIIEIRNEHSQKALWFKIGEEVIPSSGS